MKEFAKMCRDKMRRGEMPPHNWQYRVTKPERKKIYDAWVDWYVDLVKSGKPLPKRGSSLCFRGLIEEQKNRIYAARGFGSLANSKKNIDESVSEANLKRIYGSARDGRAKRKNTFVKFSMTEKYRIAEQIERERILKKIRRRHYDECTPSVDSGGFTIVYGYYRGHSFFYGNNYQYFVCSLLYCGLRLIGICFKNGIPSEFFGAARHNVNGLDLFVADNVVLKATIRNNFSRFVFDLQYKRLSEEIHEFKWNENKARNDANWFIAAKREIEEYATRRHIEHEIASACKFATKSTMFAKLPIVIRGRMLKALRDGDYKEFWRIKRVYDLGINCSKSGSASDSARQLRALGFVA